MVGLLSHFAFGGRGLIRDTLLKPPSPNYKLPVAYTWTTYFLPGVAYSWGLLDEVTKDLKKYISLPHSALLFSLVGRPQGLLIGGCQVKNSRRVAYRWGGACIQGLLIVGGFTSWFP